MKEGVWPLIYSLWIAGIMGGRMEMEVRGFMPGEWITIARRLGMGVYELRTMRGRQYIAERINQDIQAYECPYEPIIVNIDLVLLSVITILIIIALGAIINRLSNKTWKIY